LKPTFFRGPEEFRAWLERHHDEADELLVGFYRKGAGTPGITRQEAVDEALCFGWIDGKGNRIDDHRYTIRFTPRRKGSNWSEVNIKRVGELKRLRRMHPAGLTAFKARRKDRSGVYSYEQRHKASLTSAQEKRFRANKKGWAFFQASPPGYRTTSIWWVASAKREETRERRLAILIDDSENERRIAPLRTGRAT
jgi:uncharacterized protein YdeI (YjbR/CyaY-like superfamily)